MTVSEKRSQGWDPKVISRIAEEYYDGCYEKMFIAHGWRERGQDMMRKVQTRVVDKYGSVNAFEEKHPLKIK